MFLKLLKKSAIAPRGFSRSNSTWLQMKSALKRDAPLDIHPEIQEALATNKPVVALETALVTHGFPYPDNISLSMSLEDIVRSTGAIPATIGLIAGRIKIGMEERDLRQLANKEANPAKISRRDIAPAIAMGRNGGTTCSATLIFAALAGIKVFATGGLGGVHRGGENSMDISADLNELTRCPVGLVSSGVKSILDIGRTLEYLETLGVPALTYGTSREFPAFFSRHSGFEVPWNVNDPLSVAKILYTQWQLGLNNGALIAVPIPAEFEEAGMSIQKAVDQAVAESEENGISRCGKEATPWLLTRVGQLTNGSSLTSNVALLKNTALVGGEIAVQYHKIATMQEIAPSTLKHSYLPRPPKQEYIESPLPPAQLLVIGSAAVDIIARVRPETENTLVKYSTTPGTISMSMGGVARNIAEASHRVLVSQSPHLSSLLVSPVGDDAFGRLLIDKTVQFGMRTDGLIRDGRGTAICSMIMDHNGDLINGVADMDITTDLKGDTIITYIQKYGPRLVALDGNLSSDSVRSTVSYCAQNGIEVFFEPTSVIKTATILPAVAASLDTIHRRAPVTFSSPNALELAQLYKLFTAEPLELTSHPAWWRVISDLNLGLKFRGELEQLAKKNVVEEDSSKGTLAFLVDEGIVQMAVKLLPFFQHLIIKCGGRGVLVVMRVSRQMMSVSPWVDKRAQLSQRCIIGCENSESDEIIVVQHFSPLPLLEVVDVTGAGDSFVGVLLASLIQNPDTFQNPKQLNDAIYTAQTAAILSLQSNYAISPLLSSSARDWKTSLN